jgi:hypothetical protein
LTIVDSAPAPHKGAADRPPTAAETPASGKSPRRLFGWSDETRGKAEVLLIAGIALGGIVCMMAITIVVLIVQLRR